MYCKYFLLLRVADSQSLSTHQSLDHPLRSHAWTADVSGSALTSRLQQQLAGRAGVQPSAARQQGSKGLFLIAKNTYYRNLDVHRRFSCCKYRSFIHNLDLCAHQEQFLRVSIGREAGKAPESLLSVCVAAFTATDVSEQNQENICFLLSSRTYL